MGRGKPTGPRERAPIDRTSVPEAGRCDRCKRMATVRILVEPYAYVCPECLEAERAEAAPVRPE